MIPLQRTKQLAILTLAAGFAGSLHAAEPVQEPTVEPNSIVIVEDATPLTSDNPTNTSPDKRTDGLVEVRISMPDGRVIIRLVPESKYSARWDFPLITSISKTLPDGSKINYGVSGVSGGSGSSSITPVKSGGGGGGGGAGGGGGSGGGSSGGSSGGGVPMFTGSSDDDNPDDTADDSTNNSSSTDYPPINTNSKTGTNLAGIVDWSTAWTFVDVFKSRRAWISGTSSTWDDQRPIAMDADGWVTSLLPDQRAKTLMCREVDGHYPSGRYICLYEGEGTILVSGDATIISQTQGRIEIDVTPANGGIGFAISATNPENYIRNIRVIMPGFETTYATEPFHPLFLDSLRSFGTLRFMDWQKTNNAPIHPWADRPEVADAGYAASGFGVPIEVMVDLCNELGANPWFCMAHGFDDQYVDEFAQIVKARLNPALTVYVEHSNEVWNGIFGQSQYAQSQATLLNIPGGSAFEQGMRYHAQRSIEIFDIWDNYFQPENLVRVMGGWHANTWTTSTILNWNNAYQFTDAFAVAPYFGGFLGSDDNPNQTLQMTPDQVINACLADIINRRQMTTNHIAITQAHNIELIAYESGQHLVGVGSWSNNTQLTDLFIATNRHDRMYDAYRDDITGWQASGAGLMMAFSHCVNPSKSGSWGLIEYQDQPISQAPKMRAHIDN